MGHSMQDNNRRHNLWLVYNTFFSIILYSFLKNGTSFRALHRTTWARCSDSVPLKSSGAWCKSLLIRARTLSSCELDCIVELGCIKQSQHHYKPVLFHAQFSFTQECFDILPASRDLNVTENQLFVSKVLVLLFKCRVSMHEKKRVIS